MEEDCWPQETSTAAASSSSSRLSPILMPSCSNSMVTSSYQHAAAASLTTMEQMYVGNQSHSHITEVITSPNEGLSSPPTGSCGPGSTRSGGGMSPCYSNHSSSGGGNSSSTPIGGCTASPSCCENGRPLVTDPMTGQSVVCSCQYDSAARLAALSTCAAYPRLATTASGVYGTPYPSTDQNPYPSIDSSPFYSSLSNPYGLKDGTSPEMTAWTSAGLQTAPGYYHYDPTIAAYGYGTSYDLAARRKNATRESTATLKAWLSEHKKNPYPTKGEKIMLAIITKMTLTQVSTWFANARRRLKKENKMTWEPKNKTEDDEDAVLSDSADDKDKDDLSVDGDTGRMIKDHNGLNKDGIVRIKSEHSLKELDEDDDLDDEDDDDDSNGKPANNMPSSTDMLGHQHQMMSHQHLQQHLHNTHHHNMFQQQQHHQQQLLNSRQHHMMHPSMHSANKSQQQQTVVDNNVDCGIPLPPTKPKIWSLADTAACKTPPPSLLLHQQHQQQQQQQQHHHHHHHPQQQHQQNPWCSSSSSSSSSHSSATPATAGNFVAGNSSSYLNPPPSAMRLNGGGAAAAGYLNNNYNGYYGSNGAPGNIALGNFPSAAFPPEVQTDTPPQTPPSMKLPPNVITTANNNNSNMVNGCSVSNFGAVNSNLQHPNNYIPMHPQLYSNSNNNNHNNKNVNCYPNNTNNNNNNNSTTNNNNNNNNNNRNNSANTTGHQLMLSEPPPSQSPQKDKDLNKIMTNSPSPFQQNFSSSHHQPHRHHQSSFLHSTPLQRNPAEHSPSDETAFKPFYKNIGGNEQLNGPFAATV